MQLVRTNHLFYIDSKNIKRIFEYFYSNFGFNIDIRFVLWLGTFPITVLCDCNMLIYTSIYFLYNILKYNT